MFDINFITEPGIQSESSDANWSYLHKKVAVAPNTNKNVKSKKSNPSFNNWKAIGISAAFILVLGYLGMRDNTPDRVSPHRVLNQVIDLIVESGYMKNVQLSQAHFTADMVHVTIRSNELNILQDFTLGYRKEDKIPYEMFKKDELSFVNLMFPWKTKIEGGDIQTLKSLASKTVFSNKISINYSESEFELHGRSSDIISYLLQMAENDLIQKFTFIVQHLESGRYYLKVQANQV